MIVVDTNLIACLYVTSKHSPMAEEALRKDTHWAAPLLWRSELRNVMAHYMRKKLLSMEDAQHIMEEATKLMEDREYEVTSLQVLNLVAASNCTAYDCEFVALAKDLGVPLVTIDTQILNQFPNVAISLETFVT